MIHINPLQNTTEPNRSIPGIKRIAIDSWNASLDEALKVLPEDEDYPHELIRLLARQAGGREKKTWLVTRDGAPIAVVPLRKADVFSWQPVTQYILPGIVIPAIEGQLFSSLNALGLTLRLALWRTDCALPEGDSIYDLTTTATYGMSCAEDFEAYWKSTDLLRTIRAAARKWQHLRVRENMPGASDWIIFNWARKWGVAEDETQDRMLTARFLDARGKHHSLTLCDGDRPIAGQTWTLHRDTIIGQCIYRESENSQIGNWMIYLAFCWARDKGFRDIDIGGGHDYKRKFAPPRGKRHELTLSPRWRYATEQAVRGMKGRLLGLLGRSHAEAPRAVKE